MNGHKKFKLTAICISFLATPKSTSSLTKSRFKANFLPLLFTRKTTAKPPRNIKNYYEKKKIQILLLPL